MSFSPDRGQRIAIVGCGVAGLTAAWLLSRRHEVTLFEKNDYLGGHTRTLNVTEGPDAGKKVDTGFIVMNHKNYPLFTEVLAQLKVPLADSSMTFSFHEETSGYRYAGNSLRSFFPDWSYYFRGKHWRLLLDIRRFAKQGYEDLQSGALKGLSLGEYLTKRDFSYAFIYHYLYPMGAAIWSSPVQQMEVFPAEPYLHFLENHGLLRLVNRPQWKYVQGGSRTYVEAMLQDFNHNVHLSSAPQGVKRHDKGVTLLTDDGASLDFEHVVIGAHADEALRLLADADEEERALLGAWEYQDNTVVLHTDRSVLCPERKLWSSWNFTREPGLLDEQPVSVTYYMNRLQNLKTGTDYFVTLNRNQPIADEAIINQTVLRHPQYSFESMATQGVLSARNGKWNTWFCGSYFGYGFHEDAVRSAVAVAKGFGIELREDDAVVRTLVSDVEDNADGVAVALNERSCKC